MTPVRRIAINTGASFLTQISTPLSSFVLVFFIARILGPTGLGSYSSAFSLLFIFQAFVSLGYTYLITREVSQDRSKAGRLLTNATLIGVFFSLVFAGVMYGVIYAVTEKTETIRSAQILSLSLIPYSVSLVANSVCRGFERFEYITVSKVAGNGFKVVAGTALLVMGYGLVPLMVVILLSHLLSAFISLHFALRCIGKTSQESFGLDLTFCKWILLNTSVFALIIIVSTIRLNIDMLILNRMMGENEVGIYSAGYRLTNLFKMGISCYLLAIQPVIFRVFVTSRKKFREICLESIRYLFIIFIPIGIVTMILGRKFILLIFSEKFLPSVAVLSILIWTLLLFGLNQIFANMLVSGKKQKINLWANLISMFLNIGLNILLIPRYKYVGVAISSVASAFATFAFQYWYVSKYFFRVNFFRIYLKPLVAAGLMGVFTMYFRKANMFLVLPMSGLIFFAMLFILGEFTARDREMLRRLWAGESDPEPSG